MDNGCVIKQLIAKLEVCIIGAAYWSRDEILRHNTEMLVLRNRKLQWVDVFENNLRARINHQLRSAEIFD